MTMLLEFDVVHYLYVKQALSSTLEAPLEEWGAKLAK